MMTSSLSLRSTPSFSGRHVAVRSCGNASARTPRRAFLQVRAIGQVNDPEKVKDEKEKKAKEGMWAEPRNNNPLEKKTLVHGPGSDQDNTDVGEGIKGAVEGVKEKAKEVVDGAKKAVNQ